MPAFVGPPTPERVVYPHQLTFRQIIHLISVAIFQLRMRRKGNELPEGTQRVPLGTALGYLKMKLDFVIFDLGPWKVGVATCLFTVFYSATAGDPFFFALFPGLVLGALAGGLLFLSRFLITPGLLFLLGALIFLHRADPSVELAVREVKEKRAQAASQATSKAVPPSKEAARSPEVKASLPKVPEPHQAQPTQEEIEKARLEARTQLLKSFKAGLASLRPTSLGLSPPEPVETIGIEAELSALSSIKPEEISALLGANSLLALQAQRAGMPELPADHPLACLSLLQDGASLIAEATEYATSVDLGPAITSAVDVKAIQDLFEALPSLSEDALREGRELLSGVYGAQGEPPAFDKVLPNQVAVASLSRAEHEYSFKEHYDYLRKLLLEAPSLTVNYRAVGYLSEHLQRSRHPTQGTMMRLSKLYPKDEDALFEDFALRVNAGKLYARDRLAIGRTYSYLRGVVSWLKGARSYRDSFNKTFAARWEARFKSP